MLRLNWRFGEALVKNSYHDRPEGLAVLRDTIERSHRVLGPAHPVTCWVEESLEEALALPRFPPGTRVECNYQGRFCKGIVVCNHYREDDFEPGFFAPYQVQLDDDEGGDLIYARSDRDGQIRIALATVPTTSNSCVTA